MNAVNGAVTAFFDAFLTLFEWAGEEIALILVSGVFGIGALIVFKHISFQSGIKAVKDKIKGHLIEIRLYQDDLVLVTKAIGKVLGRNFQYLGLNFGPILPLLVPFAFVLAQLVVRYGFDPIPVTPRSELAATRGSEYVHEGFLAGKGTTLRVEFSDPGHPNAGGVEVRLPDGLVPTSRLVNPPGSGRAFQEIAAVEPGVYDVVIALQDGTEVEKRLVAGAETEVRWMQPERVRSPFMAVLWPAEDTLPAETGIERIAFDYPESELGWLPGGVLGIIIVFLVASMAFGFAVLKPLGIQI